MVQVDHFHSPNQYILQLLSLVAVEYVFFNKIDYELVSGLRYLPYSPQPGRGNSLPHWPARRELGQLHCSSHHSGT